MMELILGLILSWPFLAVMILLAMFSEHRASHGWTVFFTLIVSAICWKVCDIPTINMIYGAVAFVPVGLLWSFWRWKSHCDKVVQDLEESNGVSNFDFREAKSMVDPFKNKEMITYWILSWPFSVIECVIGDFIDFIGTLVRTVFVEPTIVFLLVHILRLLPSKKNPSKQLTVQ